MALPAATLEVLLPSKPVGHPFGSDKDLCPVSKADQEDLLLLQWACSLLLISHRVDLHLVSVFLPCLRVQASVKLMSFSFAEQDSAPQEAPLPWEWLLLQASLFVSTHSVLRC